jgi:hypothetical protein
MTRKPSSWAADGATPRVRRCVPDDEASLVVARVGKGCGACVEEPCAPFPVAGADTPLDGLRAEEPVRVARGDALRAPMCRSVSSVCW